MESILQQIRSMVDTGKLVKDFDYRIREEIVQFDAETLLKKLGVKIHRLEETSLFIGCERAAFYQPRELGAGIRERVTIDFDSKLLTQSPHADDCSVYCDKDARGIYSIMELDGNHIETIRRALLAYRTGLVGLPSEANLEAREQYDRAGAILRTIERIL